MAQLSRMSLLVPVFTAVQKRVASSESVPKVRARALGSARMSVTMKAAGGAMACVNAGAQRFAAVGLLWPGGPQPGANCQRTGLSRPPLASAR